MKRTHLLIVTFLFSVVLFSCQKEETHDSITNSESETIPEGRLTSTYDAAVAHSWINLELKLIKSDSKFTPPVASRALGLAGFALYESTVKGSIRYKSVATAVGAPAMPATIPVVHDFRISANRAMYELMKSLFVYTGGLNNTNAQAWCDSLYNANKIAFTGNQPAVLVNYSENYGLAVGQAIYNWSATDVVGHEAQLRNVDPAYVLPTAPGSWVPTPPAFASPVQPHWGDVRTYSALNASASILPSAPIAYSTTVGSDFYNAAMEVKNAVSNITPTQNTIALYWADGGGTFTPPGHMMAITKQVLTEQGANLEKAALVYCKVGMAISDAFVMCWKGKYNYSLMRPVTYIKANIDANWNPIFATPPFPSYTSGHSTQSAAAATILSNAIGYSYAFTDQTKVEYGFTARSFTSFFNASEEAAISRLYGGIHYSMDNEKGYNCGLQVANNIEAISFNRF